MANVAMDEMVRFDCPACGKRLKAPAEHAGKKARCRCGERVIVPGDEVVEATVVERPVHDWSFIPQQADEPWSLPVPQRLQPARPPSPAVVNTPQPGTWQEKVTGTPAYAFSLEYRATPEQLWVATLEFVGKLPDLVVLERNDEKHQLSYRSQHFQQIAVIQLGVTSTGQAEVRFQLFSEQQSSAAKPAAGSVPLELLMYTSYKTQALDANFQQVGGPGGAGEVRMAGVWKMVWGGLIGIIGLVLTAATEGQVLFYGAILTGGFMFLGGAIQSVFACNIE